VLVADGKVETFDGDLEDYRDWLTQQRLKEKSADLVAQVESDKSSNKQDRAQSKADRQARQAERRPLLKESEQIEASMGKWQAEKSQLDSRMAEPEMYSVENKNALQDILKRQAELTKQIGQAEERWLEIHEILEAIPAIA